MAPIPPRAARVLASLLAASDPRASPVASCFGVPLKGDIPHIPKSSRYLSAHVLPRHVAGPFTPRRLLSGHGCTVVRFPAPNERNETGWHQALLDKASEPLPSSKEATAGGVGKGSRLWSGEGAGENLNGSV